MPDGSDPYIGSAVVSPLDPKDRTILGYLKAIANGIVGGTGSNVGTTADPAVATGLVNTAAATLIAEAKAQLIALQAILAAAVDTTAVSVINDDTYETVAAGQTAQVIGGAGAIGDYLRSIIVQPTTVAPGVVTVIDNATTVYSWPGGTVGADLKPFEVNISTRSVSGAWKITTGSNVTVCAKGKFT